MNKVKLNDIVEIRKKIKGYILDPKKEYVIDLEQELLFQSMILKSFRIIGFPPAIKNYYAWLTENDFDIENPNPTNEVVGKYYGVKPLWITDYSLGIAVKAKECDDYYIVMECSNKNEGYKHTQVILTMGGCM